MSYVGIIGEQTLVDSKSCSFFNFEEIKENAVSFVEPKFVTDFSKSSKNVGLIVTGITLLAGIIAFGLITLRGTSNYTNEVEVLNAIDSCTAQTVTTYVEGTECSTVDLVEISKVLNNYVSVINSGNKYSNLNSLCFSEASTFAESYKDYCSNIEYSFDSNDCYARMMQEFGRNITLNNIDKVIKNEGTYYCYLDVAVPTESDIHDYIYLYSYNMTKYFTSNVVTQANVIGYLLDTLRVSKVTCSNSVLCIEMVKLQDGSFVIKDDSVITDAIQTAYTEAVNQMVCILGNNL